MPKSIFQDMVKINNTRREPVKVAIQKPVVEKVEPRTREVEEDIYYTAGVEPRAKKGHTLWIVAGFAIIFFIFSLSYFFARAEVTIDPKVKDFPINLNLSAELGGTESLSYDVVAISGEVTKVVPATEEKELSVSARGSVILYNNFSSASQKLDIDTRLEGSNGKMYKTSKALIIPGMTGTTPGSVEVSVYAVEPGVDSNSEPLDFKIFGFKGTPKYQKFYGRSKGNLSGGFKGLTHVASPEDKTEAMAELKVSLKNKLLQNATNQIPNGFILLPDATDLEIENENDAGVLSATNSLSLSLKGTLYGILFEEKKLTANIAEKVIDGYDGTDVYISNIKDLKFKLSGIVVSLKDAKKIDFNLSGSTKMVWRLNGDKLSADLAGQSKADFNKVLLQYPNVVSAHLSLSPIWNRTIPDKSMDIKIIVNYPIDALK